jgi:hypothetical protein
MKDSHSSHSLMEEHISRIDRNTEGLGETFLGRIDESKRWQTDLINAIHRDQSGATNRALRPTTESWTEREQKLQKIFLERLYFPEISDRENRIVAAHENTFQWIFKDPGLGGTPWPSFVDWLENGSGFYWITGKAGSGKSTLMK